jgi:hypothetical protein
MMSPPYGTVLRDNLAKKFDSCVWPDGSDTKWGGSGDNSQRWDRF